MRTYLKKIKEGRKRCSPWAVGNFFYLLVTIWGTNMSLAWGLVHHCMSGWEMGSWKGDRLKHSVSRAISDFKSSMLFSIILCDFLYHLTAGHFPSRIFLLLQMQRLEFLRFPSLVVVCPDGQSHSPAAGFHLCPQLQVSHLSSPLLHVLIFSSVCSRAP